MIAKCGINKESVLEDWSPHHHLHLTAYEAAVKATKHFLIAEGILICIIQGQNRRLMPHVEQESLSPPVFQPVHVTRSLVFSV